MKAFFVIGNPQHHAAMMTPVMRELAARGHAVDVLSLAELRGLPTPVIDVESVHMHKLFPAGVRRSKGVVVLANSVSSSSESAARKVAREILWRTALGPALRWHMMWLPDVVVLPNDTAFPYDRMRALVQQRGIRTVLVQEGIRFPIPIEQRAGTPYGAGGCSRVCAWGEESGAHFAAAGAPRDTIAVTGNPRFDDVDSEHIEQLRRGAGETRARHGLTPRTLLYLSNPVDDQGFMTTAEKLRLFADVLALAAPVLQEADATMAVRLHASEDAAGFARAIARSPASSRVRLVEGASLHELLAAATAAIVLSSTVGLEALLFGLPLGVIALPGYGPVHDYVRAGAAERLDVDDTLPVRLRGLLEGASAASTGPWAEARAAYVERHLAFRGEAAQRIADEVLAVPLARSAA